MRITLFDGVSVPTLLRNFCFALNVVAAFGAIAASAAIAAIAAMAALVTISAVGQEPDSVPDASAIVLLQQAEVATEKILDADGASSAYWSIGALLSEAKANDEAIRVLARSRRKAFEVTNRMRRWELVEVIAREEAKAGSKVDLDLYLAQAENEAQRSAVISSVAAGYIEGGQEAKARVYFERAWQRAQKIEGPYKEVFFLSLADDAWRSGAVETARDFFGRFRDYVRMLGGEAEVFGIRKLGEAQLEAEFRDAALKTFEDAARVAIEAGAVEDAGEVAGLMVAGGFSKKADAVVADCIKLIEKWEPVGERASLTALLADTLNREGAFPRRVLRLLKNVSAVDRAYLLPEAVLNLASAGAQVDAAKMLSKVSEIEDQVSIMCAISDAWFKAGDIAQAIAWVERGLAAARKIKSEEVSRESLLEVAEQQIAVGQASGARKTWKEVSKAGVEFRRAIQEREFFQLVEDHDWDAATAALAAMAGSPDIGVLQSGLATELAKQGQLQRALRLVEQISPSLPSRLEIIRLGYEKYGSTIPRDELAALLERHTDPEIIVSLIIGHVGGFRRQPARN